MDKFDAIFKPVWEKKICPLAITSLLLPMKLWIIINIAKNYLRGVIETNLLATT